MKLKLPKYDHGYNLDLAEPYMEEDGSLGVALIYCGQQVSAKPLSELKEQSKELSEYLEARFAPNRILWNLPGKPEVREDDPSLHRDIMRCNNDYVEFSNDLLPSVFATWQIASYLMPFLDKSPLLQIYGPPESGKGQVLDQVHNIAYRGFKFSRPSPAVLYRTCEGYRTTMAMDELQDLDNETWLAVMNVLKCAFDGTPIARCNTDNTDIEVFRTRSFMAASYKNKLPPEDVQGRSIHIPMRLNGEHRELVPIDSEEHQILRTRLLALRLKLLTNVKLAERLSLDASKAADPTALGFDGRARDIVRALSFVAGMFGENEALIETVRQSASKSAEELKETLEAQVQYALQDVWNSQNERIYVLPIREALVENLTTQGNLEEGREIKTRRVTRALKVLNYELERGAQNAPYINKLSKANRTAFDSNCKRYPRSE